MAELKLIVIEAAEKAISQIAVGRSVQVEIDGCVSLCEVLEKSSFGLTVQSPKGYRLGIPIECTTLYREALETMPRISPAAVEGAARPRGRPRASAGPAAPAAVPQPVQAAPPPAAAPAAPAAVNMAPPALPPGLAPPALPPGLAPLPAETAAEEAGQPPAWAMEQIEGIFADARRDIAEILAAAIAEMDGAAADTAVMDERPMTCGDCQNSDLNAGICLAFGQVPPMKFIVSAAANCPKFTPFAPIADSDIPF